MFIEAVNTEINCIVKKLFPAGVEYRGPERADPVFVWRKGAIKNAGRLRKKMKNISGEMDSRIHFKMFKNLRVSLPPPGEKF